jgi:hypothetical protein
LKDSNVGVGIWPLIDCGDEDDMVGDGVSNLAEMIFNVQLEMSELG